MPKAKPKTTLLGRLHAMTATDINQEAVDLLDRLQEACTLHLISELTGIARPTLYRWLDVNRPLEAMDHRVSGWFILVCETSPKIQGLLKRGKLSHPRLAKRITDDIKGD